MTKKQLLSYTEKNNLFTHTHHITDTNYMVEYLLGYESKAKKGYAPRFVNWFKITEFNDGTEFVSFDHQYDTYTGKTKRGFSFGFKLRQKIEKNA